MKKIHTPITSSFTKEKDDEQLEVLHRLSLLVWQCPGEREIPQFLQWLEELPSGELYERMTPWVQTLPAGMNEMRQRAVYLLSEWMNNILAN